MPSAIVSSLCTEQEVETISVRHDIPEKLTRCLAGNKPVCAPPDGGVGVYVDALEAGMHFPLHGFFRQVLAHFGLAPSQFTPNGWRVMAGFVVLCHKSGVEPPPLAVFRHFFSLRARGGWYHFRAKDAAGGLFTKLRKVKGWKTRFFFLTSPEPWQFPACWGGPPPKSSTGDPLLTDEEKTLAKKLLGANFSAQLPAQPPPAVRIRGINPSSDEMTEKMPAARMNLRSSGRKRKLEEANANQGVPTVKSPPAAHGDMADTEATQEALQAILAASQGSVFAAAKPSDVVALSHEKVLQGLSYVSFFLERTMDLQEKVTAREGEAAAEAAVLRQELESVKAELAEVKDAVGAVELENAKELAMQEFLGSEEHARRAPGLRCEGVRARRGGHEDDHAPALPTPRRQAARRAAGRAVLIVSFCRRSILLESELSCGII
ncbi:uncharacterized protein [Triticum aestivum]|uniref:uncharacterized protein n=1 Tax=Triticum aestivum TaxID=4565 RepID=UPI000844C66A|nr:uncharacterized protein LOC123161347 [Triticum aestivum]